MSDLVKARRLVAEIVADREEGTEDAWWHSNVSDFVLDESYGEHGGQNGADRRRILRVPAVERALIAALDLTGVEAMEAENKRLREEVEQAGRQANMARYGQPDFAWSIHKSAMADLAAEAARLRADLAVAREALEAVASLSPAEEPPPAYDSYGRQIADTPERHAERVSDIMVWAIANIARAALKETPNGQ